MSTINKFAFASSSLILLFIAGCARTPAEKEARFIDRGKALVQKHDYPRAVLEFRNAIQVMPKDAEPVYQLALVYVEMHDYRTAFALLKKAVDLNPKHAGAQILIAKFQTGAPDKAVLDEAKQRVEKVLAEKPEDPEALNTLATLDARLGDKQAAEHDLQSAIEKAPGDLQYAVNLANLKYAQKDSQGAEAVLKSAVEKDPQSSDAALILADFYLKHGRSAEAEPLVRRALELNPKSPTALLYTAAFQIDHKQMEQADATYKTLSEIPNSSYKAIHAQFLLHQGKTDDAISELNRLLKQDPADREIRTLLVSTYVSAGKPQEGQRILDEALKRNNKDIDALLQRSAFFMQTGHLSQAEADLQSVLSYNAESATAHYGLAKIAAFRGQPLVQRQELNRTLQLDPKLLAARIDLSGLIRTGNPKEAMQVLGEAPPAQQPLPAYRIEKNWVLMAGNSKDELRRNLDKDLAEQRLPELLYQDAILRNSEKDFPGARASLEELLRQQPENMSAVDLLAKTYPSQGNNAKAFETVKQYSAQRPASAVLLSLVAIWQANAQHFEEARQTFTSVVAAHPEYMPARLALSDVDVSLGKLDEAHKTLAEALKQQPTNGAARVRMAGLDAQMGNKQAALSGYRSLVQDEPQNGLALCGLAYGLAEQNPDEALKYAQNAVSLSPDDPMAQDTLGWIYYRKNLYDSALSYFKTAASKQPTAEHKYHLALAYSKMGDQQLARENLRSALQINPKLNMPEPLAQ